MMLVVNLLAFYTVATSVKAELDLMPFVSIRLYIELYPMSKEDFNWTNWSTVILIQRHIEYKIIPQFASCFLLTPAVLFSFHLHYILLLLKSDLRGAFRTFDLN